MRRALRKVLIILTCLCLSTTSVIGASTAKKSGPAYYGLKFNQWKEISADLGSFTKLDVKNHNSRLHWTCNHPDVVWVDQDGWVKTRRPGNALITVTDDYGNKAHCKVNVTCDGGLVSPSLLTQQGASKCSKLMIVAHPDDETIFGGNHLREGGWFVVCLTNGFNYRRANEFRSILNATGNRGMILNYPDFQDGQKDDWKYVKKGIAVDVERMIRYKRWKTIATHNQSGEYGHIHHKKTHSIVKEECRDKQAYDNLYYFGNFYWPSGIPHNEKRMSEREVEYKNRLLTTYQSQRGAIRNLRHIVPYENWIKAPSGEKIISRKMALKARIKGKPAKGYEVTKVTVSRKTITVKGNKSRINKISKKAAIKLTAIKVKGKKKTFKVKVPIKKLLPKGTELGNNMPKKVTVTVVIEKIPPTEKDAG